MTAAERIILARTYDSKPDSTAFEASGVEPPFTVLIPNAVLELFKLPDRGDGSGISHGGQPVEVQMLVIERYVEPVNDPVAESAGKVKW